MGKFLGWDSAPLYPMPSENPTSDDHLTQREYDLAHVGLLKTTEMTGPQALKVLCEDLRTAMKFLKQKEQRDSYIGNNHRETLRVLKKVDRSLHKKSPHSPELTECMRELLQGAQLHIEQFLGKDVAVRERIRQIYSNNAVALELLLDGQEDPSDATYDRVLQHIHVLSDLEVSIEQCRGDAEEIAEEILQITDFKYQIDNTMLARAINRRGWIPDALLPKVLRALGDE